MEPLNRQGGRLQHGGGDGCGDQHGPVYRVDEEGKGPEQESDRQQGRTGHNAGSGRQRLESDGWVLDRVRGSHRQYVHPKRPGVVTVSGHPANDLHPKTLRSILRQAGLEKP
ncbi:MAG: type II toxin-antitoxin system HicA family toxin [Nitrospirae bacterium]|nr:type II toxin-antitoxin system HicA family toxin [Fimbriimonadaceae bacterium]